MPNTSQSAGKPKNYCLFDFDNTLYRGRSHYLILDFPVFLEFRGLFKKQELQNLNELQNLYHQGLIDRQAFALRVIGAYYLGLAGQQASRIDLEAKQFWETTSQDVWFEYSFPLLDLMNRVTKTVLVSGSPWEVLRSVYRKLGVQEVYATQGVIENGKYTGQFRESDEMGTSLAKATLMQKMLEQSAFEPHTSFAFGDSESDFPLLNAVDPQNAYLIGTSEKLAAAAIGCGWNMIEPTSDLLAHVQSRLRQVFWKNREYNHLDTSPE